MTDKEIKDIARKYAEEAYPTGLSPKSFYEAVATEVIELLLRDHCVVSKSDLKTWVESREYILSHKEKYDRYISDEAEVELRLLRLLFGSGLFGKEDEE